MSLAGRFAGWRYALGPTCTAEAPTSIRSWCWTDFSVWAGPDRKATRLRRLFQHTLRIPMPTFLWRAEDTFAMEEKRSTKIYSSMEIHVHDTETCWIMHCKKGAFSFSTSIGRYRKYLRHLPALSQDRLPMRTSKIKLSLRWDLEEAGSLNEPRKIRDRRK